MNDPKAFRFVGSRSIRPDGVEKVTGRAQYGADLSLPGMLTGKIVRSTRAHARIRHIDVTQAMSLPGVLAVITGDDFPDLERRMLPMGEQQMDVRDFIDNTMARGKVLYHGHAVAAVAAVSPDIAAQAAELIKVEYEPLPVVMDLDAALAPQATLLHEDQVTLTMQGPVENPVPTNVAFYMPLKKGDIDTGFAAAEVVLENTYTTKTVHQGYIEPHACVADAKQGGRIDIWCSTQGPFLVRTLTALALEKPVSDIKVTPSEIGGGFGGKLAVYLEPVAALLSMRSGRPVKLVMSREEVLRATGPTSATRTRVKVGAKKDGTLTAVQAKLEFEAGAFKGSPVVPAVMTMLAAYELDHVLVEGYDIVVNKPKVAAYRAPGAPQAAFAIESILDELAGELGIDPIDLRLKNAVSEGSMAVYGPQFKAIGLKEALQAVKTHPVYADPVGPNQGRGVALGFWFNVGMQSSAAVRLNENGSATVITGNPDIGGSRASMALMAAEELGIPAEQVQAVVGNTETIGYCDVTGGSRTTFATGMAVIEAARDAVARLCERAALTWDVPVEQVSWAHGQAIHIAGDHAPLSLDEITANAIHTGGPIAGAAQVNAQDAGPGFGVQCARVQVDPETGYTRVIGYVAAQDVGKAIHPSYVEGQLQGGVAQGIGWTLNEEYIYDADGVLLNAGFLDYRVPVASDLPMIDTILVEVPHPSHPYGVRGVGETPIVPPLAAMANAIAAASGVRMRDLPISPPRLYQAITAQGA
ncbi:MAG: xanthine dehydrogenase family protein molybdopterin-binding subunit [Pseudomonadota bacterium]|nr:xanthine dehydrogenase family protein molybdopterin-binding subunit [Pseudomonadota bacterium]